MENQVDSVIRYPEVSPVFFIGASLGGVKAFIHLVENLPDDFPAPVFLLLHRIKNSDIKAGDMRMVLQAKTRLTVENAVEGEVVRSGHIYLPPDNLHIGVEDNRIKFYETPDESYWRPAIDVMFKSAAREYTDRTVAILLTGNLDDGVQGLRETSAQGGITVAQSPEDAYAPYLPLNAVMNDHPSHVLPLKDIPKLMCELTRHPHFDDQESIAIESAKVAKELKKKLK
ncbi:chemotaxis protein CheB [Alteromonas sp. 1_MG-2023]|uniref:chemotaxis protein CheB n=1 Tax=Alteromonas sp. 1_MG-2023 TaxID=3062669 RepID=UPI0026E2CBEB|nr:chemotaxis protein CheB [Alteromonas sp. 1_MG-2023]MDO6477450.1 chemotaxis protein CheB [Alteromonas sp. 1_MG-2023]